MSNALMQTSGSGRGASARKRGVRTKNAAKNPLPPEMVEFLKMDAEMLRQVEGGRELIKQDPELEAALLDALFEAVEEIRALEEGGAG